LLHLVGDLSELKWSTSFRSLAS